MKKYRYLIFGIIVYLVFSCKEELPLPQAAFNFTLEGDCNSPVLEVHFENLSSHASTYLWNFGDGTTSEESNPKKIYAKAGVYPVSLTAINSGKTSLQISDVGVFRNSDGEGPSAEFQVVLTTQYRTYEFTITNFNSETEYYWWFGDGTGAVANTQLTKHTYPGPAVFTAQLNAKSNTGQSCSSKLIAP
jgi:PKD repeat protein